MIFDILKKTSSKVETTVMKLFMTDNQNLNLIARLILKLHTRFGFNNLKSGMSDIKEVGKGNRRMPWLSKAKKDVISCDKLRGGANDL